MPTAPESSTHAVDGPIRLTAPRSHQLFKACVDRYAALVALVLAAPLMLVIALLIRRDSPGPAMFRQTRAGRYGRPYSLYKFRTMRTDVDPFGDSPRTGDDPRITRLGRWLRETSLDELPQLINVVRGEMSLVGPRPLYLQQMAEWDVRQRGRLLVKPGLTGLAQISGRGSLTIEDKLEFDVQYVQHMNPGLDLQIVWRTIRSVGQAQGIYEVRYSRKSERRKA